LLIGAAILSMVLGDFTDAWIILFILFWLVAYLAFGKKKEQQMQ
jgi:hypothetical protein